MSHTLSDYPYEITNAMLGSSSAFDVCRRAVLLPMMRGRCTIPAAYEAVLKAWRARLWALRIKANWEHVASSNPAGMRNWQYMRNCPPCGVVFQRRAHCCKRVRFCPWCYGREVIYPIYSSLDWALRMLDADNVRDQVVVITARRSIPIELADDPAGHIAKLAKTLMTPVRKAVEYGVDVLGSIVSTTLEPGPTPGTMTATRGAIMLAPAGTRYSPELFSTVIKPPFVPDKKKLCEAIRWAFPYPVGMMRGDVQETARLLEAASSSRFKLVQYDGLCDNRKFRTICNGLRGNMTSYESP